MLTCLQNSQAKVHHLQTQPQLQHGDIQRRNQRSKLFFVQNPLFEFYNESYQLSGNDQLSEEMFVNFTEPRSNL